MILSPKRFGPALCVLMMSVAAFGQKHSVPPPPPKAPPAASRPVGNETSTEPVPKAAPNGPSEPLSAFRMDLLTIRDNPSELTDKRLAEFTREQVGVEQSEWQELDTKIKYSQKRGSGLRPNTFEWEKLINEQPDFARGPLLDIFMRTDASWSFVQHPDSSIVMTFLFSREHVQGRQAEFTAQELLPVSKQFLQLAASKESTNLWLSEALPPWQYDFATKSIKFGSGPVHILKPVFDREANPADDREYFDELPGAAHGEADMWIGPPQHDAPEVKPGANSGSPSELWRDKFSFLKLPTPTVIALDRQLRIVSVPLAPAAAEQLQKLGNTLLAKVYITADRMDPIRELHPERVNGPTMILFAHLQKVEIVNARGGIVAVLQAEQLPQPTPIPKVAPALR